MIKFLIKAISRSLGFSKSESRGTLILILIMLVALIISNYRISTLRNDSVIVSDSSNLAWINEVQSSYEIRKNKIETKKIVDESSEKSVAQKVTNNKIVPSSSNERNDLHMAIKDLNTATAEELRAIKGIGKSFSERIVKYRTLLGGFSDSTQLKEVYGLPEETISQMLKSFSIQSNVKSIEINSDSIRLLASHPYISYDLARVIINYRKQHGDIKSIQDLKKIKAMDDRTFSRLKPYLE